MDDSQHEPSGQAADSEPWRAPVWPKEPTHEEWARMTTAEREAQFCPEYWEKGEEQRCANVYCPGCE